MKLPSYSILVGLISLFSTIGHADDLVVCDLINGETQFHVELRHGQEKDFKTSKVTVTHKRLNNGEPLDFFIQPKTYRNECSGNATQTHEGYVFKAKDGTQVELCFDKGELTPTSTTPDYGIRRVTVRGPIDDANPTPFGNLYAQFDCTYSSEATAANPQD